MINKVKTHASSLRITALSVVLVALLLLPTLTSADMQTDIPREDSTVPSGSAASRILHADDSGMSFELITPPANMADDGSLQVNGLEQIFVEPGSPALPYFSTYIALPPEASAAVEVSESDLLLLDSLSVLPVPQVQLEGEAAVQGDDLVFAPGSVIEQEPQYIENQTIYRSDAPFPGISYRLSEPMYLRDMRMVELKLYPLQYNPQQKTLKQASRMVINIHFSDATFDNLQPVSGLC